VILEAIETYFEENKSSEVKVVKLVLFDQSTVDAFLQV